MHLQHAIKNILITLLFSDARDYFNPDMHFPVGDFFKTGPFAGLQSNETGRSLTDSTWYQHPYGAFQVHATPIWNRIRSGCLMATSNRESTSEYTIHRQRNACSPLESCEVQLIPLLS